jgi:hypothetical protein
MSALPGILVMDIGEGLRMSIIYGTYRRGRIELDALVDWADGVRVEVAAVGPDGIVLGRRDVDWPETPEEREAMLARLETIEPLQFTPEEEAEIAAARAEVRGVTLAAVRKKMGLE